MGGSAAGTSGQVLTSAGAGVAPTWATPGSGGTVTSVAATVPAFLSVTGSPVTTSGTLAISYSGTALPVANGGTGVTTSTGTGNTVLSTSPTFVTPILGTPTSVTLTNGTGLPLTTGVTGTLPVANGGTGTTTPALVAGTNVTITGTWPNQTINSSGSGGGSPATPTVQGTVYGNSSSTALSLTSIGYSAGSNNTGSSNTAIGYQTLSATSSSNSNTAVGYRALAVATTGNSNTGIGSGALVANTTGIGNSALGVDALSAIISGSYNTAIGYLALGNSDSASYNTALGQQTGLTVSTGANNTLLGYSAGFNGGVNLTTGSNNILIGYQAAPTSASVSNENTFGNSSTTSNRFFGDMKMGGTAAGTSGQVLTSAGTGVAPTWATPSSTFKNRIINGAMVIDQRNGGASVTVTTAEEFITDRWQFAPSASSKLTAQQSTTAPTGFSNSLLLTSSAATSVAAGDYYFLQQKVEGFNFADCGWGTASAETVTLSFWCRSSVTGTYGGALVNSAQNRSYAFSYTISAANTFEYKTVTIAGDTSGTWVGATNGTGVRLRLGFGIGSTYSGTANVWTAANYMAPTGSTNWISTSGATFYLTGVQLEKNTIATSFAYQIYSNELISCQRYFQMFKGSDTITPGVNAYTRIGMGPCQSATTGIIQVKPLVTFRSNPSLTNSGSFALYDGVTVTAISGITIDISSTPYSLVLAYTGGTLLTPTRTYEVIINNDIAAYIWLTSEL